MAVPKKIINGYEFDKNTPEAVVNILLRYMHDMNVRIRLFYGDTKTGKDWCEEYDTMGYVGGSTGKVKIPILINNRKSWGGGAILTGSIVRITIDKKDVYRHPKYHIGKVELKPSGYADVPYGVWIDGKNHANFKTPIQAQKWAEFIKGNTNSKS